MMRTDVLVEVRDKSLARKGTITAKYLKLTATLRWCNVGEWSITLPGNHPMVSHLSTDGSGIIVSLYGEPHFSGPTSKPKRKRDRQNPDGTFTFVGVTDEILLADALAFPQPGNANPSTQTQANDVRSGKLETLMYQYVSRNIGPLAPAGRRRGLRTAVTVAADLARGATVQKSPRFQNLLELEQELALLSDGTLGFRMVQNGSSIEFEVVGVVDRTDLVRLDIQNGTLTSEEVERTGPTITYAIVAGQGSGTDRQIVARTTAESVAAEGDWGRPIERFIDQRDTNVTTELNQSGDEALFEGGFTATAVKVVPSDNQTMQYAVDWREGDLITVIVNGQETSTTVTAAAMIVDDKVCAVGAAIGNVTGFDKGAALTERVEDVEKRVGKMERSLELGDDVFVPALPDPNADRILFWDDSAGAYAWLAMGTNLSITGTTLNAASPAAASDTVSGIVELATSAEVITGTDTARAVTPAGLAARTATDTRQGIVELATTAEATTGTDTARAVTPAGLLAAFVSRFTPWKVAAGNAVVGAGGNVAVSYPVGRFSVPPILVVMPRHGSNVTVAYVIESSRTATGFNVSVYTIGGGLVAGSVDWIAIQMGSGAAAG